MLGLEISANTKIFKVLRKRAYQLYTLIIIGFYKNHYAVNQ